jgi:hypothetical protein
MCTADRRDGSYEGAAMSRKIALLVVWIGVVLGWLGVLFQSDAHFGGAAWIIGVWVLVYAHIHWPRDE